MIGSFGVDNPTWLLALPFLAAALIWARWPWLVAARRSDWGWREILGSEGRRFLFRFVWLGLLVFALAEASITRPLGRQATILVLDDSASVAPVQDQIAGVARQAEARLSKGDVLGVVGVAAAAWIEESPSTAPAFQQLQAVADRNATDLAAGLRLAGAALPPGFVGHLVLVSDGRPTRGDAVTAARELATHGITVDVLPVGPIGLADVRLETVDFPPSAHQGEVATLTARLSSGVPTRGTLRVFRDDQLVAERAVALQAGRQDLALPVAVGDPGLHRYRVEVAAIDSAADSTTINNQLGAIQRVVGPPRVLVVAPTTADAGYLPAALRAGGALVDLANPGEIPADLTGWARYDAVVLANLPAESLPAVSQDQLERYVRDLGRGLAMTGGPDSFGPGGYAGTPVERALPVYMDLHGRGKQPRVAMVLVIDKSGSMEGQKIALAKEAAARSVRLLHPTDQVAVLAFDSVPQWVAPLTPVSQIANPDQAIGGIYAGGGTEIYPAMAAAYATLRDANADVKHVILLTDGQSGSSGDYAGLVRQMKDARITLSTVAVGDDADTALLQAMARADGGRFHFTDDPATIPEIFAQETVMATRSILVDARFVPASAEPASPLLSGLKAAPPLDGYVAVTPKESAEVSLVSPEADPVLAAWQYGLGRAVAWTPDVGGRWSAGWADSSAATLLWGNILSWLLPPADTGGLQVQVDQTSDGATIVAETATDWTAIRPTVATLVGPTGKQQISLAPAGPGQYNASLGQLAAGAYIVQVSQTATDGTILRGETGWVAPYPAEYRDVGIDLAYLGQIAAAGDGRILDDPAQIIQTQPEGAPRSAAAVVPLAPALLVLAAVLWPIEIASRRLILPRPAISFPLPRRVFRRLRRRRSNAPSAEGDSSASTAVETTRRLLERKRTLRGG